MAEVDTVAHRAADDRELRVVRDPGEQAMEPGDAVERQLAGPEELRVVVGRVVQPDPAQVCVLARLNRPKQRSSVTAHGWPATMSPRPFSARAMLSASGMFMGAPWRPHRGRRLGWGDEALRLLRPAAAIRCPSSRLTARRRFFRE